MKIFIAGHRGMVGAAILRKLDARRSAGEDITIIVATRSELELTDQRAVKEFMASTKPDMVILAAARVGGIYANDTYPAEFIYENLMIECNVIHQAYQAGVRRVLYLGSSCIYPKGAPQPMRENDLLTGKLEPTNEPYAIAKIAGLKLCESYNRQYGTDYRSIMPTNLYGPGDNFHSDNGHVLPALLRRFHEAVRDGLDVVTIWGTGKPVREFLHVDDMAAAAVFVMNAPQALYETHTEPTRSHINVGTSEEISILDLAKLIARVTGFNGRILTDETKPDGSMRKLLDVSLIKRMGWTAEIPLERGIANTYNWFLNNQSNVRGSESNKG